MRRSYWSTIAVGAAIGGLNIAHYYATGGLAGVEKPFGLFPGGFPVAVSLGFLGNALSPDLQAMIVLGLGIIIGSMLSACQTGDLTLAKFRARKLPRSKVLRAAIGGILVGAGTWMAQGCLIKHTLSGAPGLMLSSFAALAGIIAGIALSARADERWG